MKRFGLKSTALLIAGGLVVVACGPTESTSSRDRNVGSGGAPIYEEIDDLYERAISRPYDTGYTRPITDGKWDPTRYDVGPTRAQMATPRVEALAPPVPKRSFTPPPVPEGPYLTPVTQPRAQSLASSTSKTSSSPASKSLSTKSGAPMKLGSLGKVLGGLGNAGAMLGASLAVAGIGMALDALGAPPWLTALFGGGDAATAAALAAIQKTLEEINKKIDQALEKLDNLQGSVDDVNAAIQSLAKNSCDTSTLVAWTSVSNAIDATELAWRDIYVNNTLLRDNVNGADFTAAQSAFLKRLRSGIDPMQAKNTIDKITRAFVGSAQTGTALGTTTGLLAQVQKCTLVQNRFLTNADTTRWEVLGNLMIVLAAHAAQVAIFAEWYDAATATPRTQPDIESINEITASLRQSAATIGFHVSMQIPEGQVLDTVTNKMWRLAPSGMNRVALIDALKGCVPEDETLINYAPVPSWNGFETRDLSSCVSSLGEANKSDGLPLDMSPYRSDARKASGTDWRIPVGGELIKAESNFAATVPAYQAGLLDGGRNQAGGTFTSWNTSKCGESRAATCLTPADYLASFGAGETFAGLSAVWTNTSLAEVGLAGSSSDDGPPMGKWTTTGPFHGGAYGAFNRTAAHDNKSLRLADDQTYGFCEDGVQMYVRYNGSAKKYEFGCSRLDGSNVINPWTGRPIGNIFQIRDERPLPALPAIWSQSSDWFNGYNRDNFCFRFTSSITKSGHTRNEWYSPYHAEVGVVNLGNTTQSEPAMVKIGTQMIDMSTPKNYLPISPGKTAGYFANRNGASDAVVACAHDWYTLTVAKIPQKAQTVWVRDLGPNEIYYSLPSDIGPTSRGDMRDLQPQLEPPMVSVITLGGKASIVTRQASSASDPKIIVKCLINSATEPETPEDVLNAGSDCPLYNFDLPAGGHEIRAVAARTVTIRNAKGVVTTRTLTSPIETASAIIFDLSKPGQLVTAPSTASQVATIAPEIVLDSARATTVFDTETPSPVGAVQVAPIQVSNASSGSVDVATLLRKAKIVPRVGDRVTVTVAKTSRKTCRFEKPSLYSLKPGKCSLTIKVTSRRGSSVTKKLTLRSI